jgi:hypothetical protein
MNIWIGDGKVNDDEVKASFNRFNMYISFINVIFNFYSPPHRVQTGSGVHPASYPVGTGDSFSEGKAAAA